MKIFHKAFKALLLASICLLSMWTHAQLPVRPSTLPSPKSPPAYYEIGTVRLDSFGVQFVPRQGDYQPVTGLSGIRYYRDSLFYWRVDSSDWAPVSQGKGNIIPAGPFTTSNIGVGYNPCTNCTAAEIIQQVWYAEQPPTTTLTGGTTLELTASSSVTRQLNLTACRGSNTTNLIRISVHGSDGSTVFLTFTNPSQNACITPLTPTIFVPANTNITYTDTVTTQSGKQATATTSFNFQSKEYIGFVTTNTPSDADILAATNGTVGGFFNNSVRQTTGSLSTPASLKYVVIAYPASWGLATIKIGGFETNYTLTTRSFVNASGYSVSYNIYVSPFPTAGAISYQIL